jgi:pimeloyl-ACP methyl ester carboxylesterase
MAQVTLRGIRLDYDTFGPPTGHPLLLIMGLAMQRVSWPQGFIDLLVERGYRVITFDNRDIGLSQRYDEAGAPSLAKVIAWRLLGARAALPFTLADIADDAAALLEHLGIARADVAGISMGGMIAQHLAARHPGKVRSLVLMATTGGRLGLPPPRAAVRRVARSRPKGAHTPEQAADYSMRLFRVIGSPRYPTPPEVLYAHALAAARRAPAGAGVLRQVAAVIADGDRRGVLRQIAAPTLVLHGDADLMVPIAHGHDLARQVRGARFARIEGWGHDLPAPLWPVFAGHFASLLPREAGGAGGSGTES